MLNSSSSGHLSSHAIIDAKWNVLFSFIPEYKIACSGLELELIYSSEEAAFQSEK